MPDMFPRAINPENLRQKRTRPGVNRRRALSVFQSVDKAFDGYQPPMPESVPPE